MADRPVFQWMDNNGVINAITAAELEKMTIPQFATIENRLLNVRHDRRYDTAIHLTNTTALAGTKKNLFRKGLDQQETYVGSATEYTKDYNHTNMLRDGEFEQGDWIIIKNLEVELPAFGGKPTTQAAGKITNAKATFPATYDPSLAIYAFLSQLWIRFKRGKTVIFENKAINFPQKVGIFATYGANSGAYAQNGAGMNLMPNVQVLAGGDDFGVEAELLADFDLTTATGLNMEWFYRINLETIELRRNYE